MKLNIKCPFCNRTSTVEVNKESFYKWKSGTLIQNAMPELSKQDRELLISGICSLCWEDTFQDKKGN